MVSVSPLSLQLMHALSQQSISSNPCDPLHCSHLCLLAPAVRTRSRFGAPAASRPSAVCRCPKGMMLSKDKVTCTPPVESSFILLLSRSTIYQVRTREPAGLCKLSRQVCESSLTPPSTRRSTCIPLAEKVSL